MQAQCNDLLDDARLLLIDPPPDDEDLFGGVPTLQQLSRLEPLAWPIATAAEQARERASARIALIEQLSLLAGEFAVMDYRFLYDRTRDLLSIGYNVDERRLDAGYYDLLASEARLASFVAIAQGQLPQENWFALGRLLTTSGGEPVLLSWTGSMFEYLMPMLVMPSYDGTLLDQTCRAAVARQIEYGNQLDMPVGHVRIRLQRARCALQLPVPRLRRPRPGAEARAGRGPGDRALCQRAGADGRSGRRHPQHERLVAEECTGPLRLVRGDRLHPGAAAGGQNSAIVRSFMAHHQGMSLLALAHALLDQPMQRRFAADPQCQATTLLLQERVPKTAAEYLHASGFPEWMAACVPPKHGCACSPTPTAPARRCSCCPTAATTSWSPAPAAATAVAAAALTRWREDITRDNWGMFCYLRDVDSGDFWSTTYQPTRRKTEQYEAIFSEARAEFRVRERDIDAHTEIVVSPEDDIELRRIRLTNRGRARRTIELTSYAEVVLAPAIADAMHPAFSKLFVQTELVPRCRPSCAAAAPAAHDETVPWMCHLMAVHDADIDEISYETDRARFIGRGRDACRPAGACSEPSDRFPTAPARCSIRSWRSARGSRLEPDSRPPSTW